MIKLLSGILLGMFGFFSEATANQVHCDSIPSVFMIGDYELDYESLVVECNNLLLNVCEESMAEAYEHWLLMLHDIELYAEEQNIEIRGVKLWLNAFWNPDGSIKHLVFYPKPNCRNMDFEELTLFFQDFLDGYEFTKSYAACFAHYGSASFPTHTQLLFQESSSETTERN